MVLVGDEATVRKRFPSGQLGVGKLGVGRSSGKDDRLIGDLRASGTSPASKFSDRAALPIVYRNQRIMCCRCTRRCGLRQHWWPVALYKQPLRQRSRLLVY